MTHAASRAAARIIGLLQSCCGFVFLAGLVSDDAALRGRESTVSSGRDAEERHRIQRRAPGVLLLCLLLVTPFELSKAAEPVFDIDIPAMNAADALNRLAEQTGSVMLFSYDLAQPRQANAVRGRYTLLDGLERLLQGTGLSGGLSNKRVVMIAEEGVMPAVGEGSIKKRGVFASIIAALAFGAADGAETDQNSKETKLEEIVVTAQKRQERLQDVPVPVTAIPAETLVNSNQLRLQDYYLKIPGLNVVTFGTSNGSQVAIRGITTGGAINNPTVAVVVDDVPFGATVVIGNGDLVLKPDFDPSELSRIEVLRGPQGTLYGASSLGGLLKFVTIDPSTQGRSGRLQVGLTDVEGGNDPGYNVRGALNLPLSDQLAVRLSGTLRREPGYIDNVQTDQEDVNLVDSESVQLGALWQPSDAFTLKLSALYQDTQREGSSESHLSSPIGPVAGLGSLQQSALIGTGKYDQQLQAYSATADLKLGRAEFTSISGYNIGEGCSTFDNTPLLGFLSPVFFPGFEGAAVVTCPKATKFSQELRLSTALTERIEWLFGAFYTDEEMDGDNQGTAVDIATGEVGGIVSDTQVDSTYTEYAVFTDLTFQLTDRFDVQIGGRQSHIEADYTGFRFSGPFISDFLGLPDPFLTPAISSEDDAFTYLLTPRFRISSDLMIYGRMASGYRPGGPNGLFFLLPGFPTEYAHDETRTYEIGSKGNVFTRMLSFDVSLFYIDWRDVVVPVVDTFSGIPVSFNLNAGRAESQGVELALEIRPTERLTISGSGTYNDAELAEIPPNITLTAEEGSRLPYSARKSGSLSVDQEIALPRGAVGFFGASISYVGDRKGQFQTGAPQGTLPSYTQTDLRAGVQFDTWLLNAYVNNLTDERGVLRGGPDSVFPFLITYIQPRTIGLSLTKEF